MMNIHESAEDYLEAMLMLKEERGYVRAVDVAEKLGVTLPSVSYATKRLREDGYIAYDPARMIVLLEPGLKIAEKILERHRLLTELLIGLGVGAACVLFSFLHMDMVLIGAIMLLIPGLAMINAVRNVLLGDTISGLVRLADSLLWAGSLAGGFMVALKIIDQLF